MSSPYIRDSVLGNPKLVQLVKKSLSVTGQGTTPDQAILCLHTIVPYDSTLASLLIKFT
jgi:hypothetical protein